MRVSGAVLSRPLQTRLRYLLDAARRCGRPWPALALEAITLRLSGQRLGISEYLDFRLYEQDLTPAQKRQFSGYRAQHALEDLLVDDYSKILSLDKLSFYALMQGYGLPIPRTVAVYGPTRGSVLGEHLPSPQALRRYLAGAPLPLYLKPSFGSYGRGNVCVVGRDGERLLLGNGTTQMLDAFVESVGDDRGFGWLIQEALSAHPDLVPLCGPKVSGVRMHTFFTRGGPVVTHAIWKINAGTKDSDNFEHGRSGNLLADVDVDTGMVRRVVSGVGPGQIVNAQHPSTGAKLVGIRLPDWPLTCGQVVTAATAFPGYVFPGWDIALTADGPKFLEVNFFGDIDLPQHASRRGLLGPVMNGLLRERGLDALLAGRARPGTRNAHNGRMGARKAHWPW